MKTQITCLLLAATLGSTCAGADNLGPGHIDFGRITEAAGASTVDVHLKGPTLSMVARMTGEEDGETAALLRSLHLVRVHVFKLDEQNRAEVQKRIGDIRAELSSKKWEQLVSVRDKKEDVAVYLKTRGEEAIEGIVVTVLGGEAVLINVVGDLKPEQLGKVASYLNLKPLEKFAAKAKRK